MLGALCSRPAGFFSFFFFAFLFQWCSEEERFTEGGGRKNGKWGMRRQRALKKDGEI